MLALLDYHDRLFGLLLALFFLGTSNGELIFLCLLPKEGATSASLLLKAVAYLLYPYALQYPATDSAEIINIARLTLMHKLIHCGLITGMKCMSCELPLKCGQLLVYAPM